MIKYGLIIAIVILLIYFRARIKDAILGILLLGGLIFFAIFLVDSTTKFPLRSIFNMDKYDDVVQNPGEHLTNVKDKVVDGGKGALEYIGERGDELDEHYGTGIGNSNEDVEEKGKGKKDKGKEKDTSKKGSDTEKVDVIVLEGNQYSYADRDADLANSLKGLGEKEKSIIQGLSNLLNIEIETDGYIITTYRGKDYYEVTSK